jgi:hypothetical protein
MVSGQASVQVMSRTLNGLVVAAILCAGLTLSACSAPAWSGKVSGRLLLRSGTPGTPDQPVSGTVIIGTPTVGHYGEWIPVDSSGAFRRFVPTGSYPMIGHSPSFGHDKLTCRASPRSVTVTKGSTSVRDVICHVGPSR